MKKRVKWLPVLAALLSTGLLFAIGNVFNIALLEWNFYYTNTSEENLLELKGSFVPFFAGLVVLWSTKSLLARQGKKHLDNK